MSFLKVFQNICFLNHLIHQSFFRINSKLSKLTPKDITEPILRGTIIKITLLTI